jgi:hypothetical protein
LVRIGDITKVDSPDKFERPIHAGNAIAKNARPELTRTL